MIALRAWVLSAGLALPGAAYADDASAPVNRERAAANVYEAIEAVKHGDHRAAARYFEDALATEPRSAALQSKACEQYEALGELGKARAHCRAALSSDGSSFADYAHYARVVLAKPGALEREDIADLDGVVAHLTSGSSIGHAAGYDVECQLGDRLDDVVRLSECAPALAKLAPDHPRTTYFARRLALTRGGYGAALAGALLVGVMVLLVRRGRFRSRAAPYCDDRTAAL